MSAHDETRVELLAEALPGQEQPLTSDGGATVTGVVCLGSRTEIARSMLRSEPFRRLLDGVREEERAGIRAAVEGMPSSLQKYPTVDPRWVEEGCAHHYGNTTYECSCLVPRTAVLAILDRALGGRDEQP